MATVINGHATASLATPTRWEAFRVLLEEQRADCVRQRELALAEAATSMPDPVAMRRGASMLLTIAEIDAALDRIAGGTLRAVHPLRDRHPDRAAGVPAVRVRLRRLPGIHGLTPRCRDVRRPAPVHRSSITPDVPRYDSQV